ncbi:MAG: hypothetical protein KBC73_24580 [Burkholderiaceae bacterium]|nr:hypothetical protein [Burkholderiaceae bacterium]
MIPAEFRDRLQTVRSHYRVAPWIVPREDEGPLLRSWQRCREAGMREHECINFEPVGRAQLAEIDERWQPLVQLARPETERLAAAVAGAGGAVLLFNPRGVIVDRLCHDGVLHPVLRVATRVGINVAERCVGTTAPAIALNDGLPYLVGRDAHFFANVRPFFCVAAPIDDPRGERLGALDLTWYDDQPAFDVLSLVADAAVAVENRMFRPEGDTVVVHFHPRAELVDTPLQALLSVDGEGRVSGANRAALRLLCQPRQALLGRPFAQLFDRRLGGLFGPVCGRGAAAGLVEMHSHSGMLVAARFECALRGAPGPAGPSGLAGRAAELPAPRPAEADPVEAASAGSMRELELRAIDEALLALGGNVSAAARRLGISRSTIYRRRQGLI